MVQHVQTVRTFNFPQVCKLSPSIHELLYNAMGENMIAIDFDKSVGKAQIIEDNDCRNPA